MAGNVLAGDGYVASEERDVSTAFDMTNTFQSSRLSIPQVSSRLSGARGEISVFLRPCGSKRPEVERARDDNLPHPGKELKLYILIVRSLYVL